MPTATQQTDPRREHLRRQAIIRRQRVFERISAVRTLIVGGVVAATCVMVGYLDANAHTRSTSSSTAVGSGLGSSGSSNSGSTNFGSSNNSGGTSAPTNSGSQSNSGGGSNQNLLGGGSPPSSSSGTGSVISGGS